MERKTEAGRDQGHATNESDSRNQKILQTEGIKYTHWKRLNKRSRKARIKRIRSVGGNGRPETHGNLYGLCLVRSTFDYDHHNACRVHQQGQLTPESVDVDCEGENDQKNSPSCTGGLRNEQ